MSPRIWLHVSTFDSSHQGDRVVAEQKQTLEEQLEAQQVQSEELQRQLATMNEQHVEAERQNDELRQLMEHSQAQGADVAREMVGLRQQLAEVQASHCKAQEEALSSWHLVAAIFLSNMPCLPNLNCPLGLFWGLGTWDA